MEKVRLISLEMYQEEEEYFLKAVYQVEDERGIWEETYPKIFLPIIACRQPTIHQEFSGLEYNVTVNLGFGELPLKKVGDNTYAEKKLVREKVHDMTIAEIEKKLGYKIKIVREKGE